MPEIVGLGPTSAELFDGSIVRLFGLEPDTVYEVNGVTFRTLPDIGTVSSRVCTMNDVHLGETECGKFGGGPAQFVSLPGERPYPTVMNESAASDALSLEPDLVVVRGDLTDSGEPEQYEEFLRIYRGTFGDSLLHVRGNHDGYTGREFANWPVQSVDIPGLRIVLIDTARPRTSGGSIDNQQIEEVLALVRSASTPSMLMGHHPLDVPGAGLPADGVNAEDAERFIEAIAMEKSVVGYSAGHTHRCHFYNYRGVPLIEVASVKDFPGAFAEYQVGSRGISQTVRRASSPEALVWSERTRGMFDGFYETYALGSLEARGFVLPLER